MKAAAHLLFIAFYLYGLGMSLFYMTAVEYGENPFKHWVAATMFVIAPLGILIEIREWKAGK